MGLRELYLVEVSTPLLVPAKTREPTEQEWKDALKEQAHYQYVQICIKNTKAELASLEYELSRCKHKVFEVTDGIKECVICDQKL